MVLLFHTAHIPLCFHLHNQPFTTLFSSSILLPTSTYLGLWPSNFNLWTLIITAIMRTRRAVRRVEVAESVEKGYSSDEQPSTDDGDMETGWVHKRKVSAMRKRQKRNPSYVIGEEMIQPNYQNYRYRSLQPSWLHPRV